MNISEIHTLFLQSTGVCTDTRQLKKGNLYIALKGDNFNGNAFAKAALDKGASAAIIDEENYLTEGSSLVNTGLQALQDLAQYHRSYLNIPIIALTGSNGKTTTKELINAVLSQMFSTVATVGNLNNHIGVPLTLLSMTKETEIGIVEMGANHQGEIAALCEIAQPNFG
jgi:UDP-N-acetylmuramoyl-tripeptide--D-alanyl-D-alanine ligase